MIDIRKEAVKVVAGLIYVILFFLAIRYFGLKILQIYIILCAINLIQTIYKKSSFSSWVKNSIYLGVFFIVLYYLGAYGIVGYIFSCIFISAWILYKRRKKYFEVKHHIESMIWGKPLYKFKEEGNKIPKLKFDF